MAWIESHQELGRHPKAKRLARAIDTSLPAAVGHLHFLWWWAMDFAQDGDLSDYTDEDIADAAAWDGDARQFVKALVATGFVDDEDGQRHIHDWHDYVGRLLYKREQNRERSKRAYNAKKGADGEDSAEPSAQSTRSQRAENAQTARETRKTNAATLPYHTEPDQTIPDPTEPTEPTTPTASGGSAAAGSDEQFDAFWALYPKKVGKGEARKAWKKARPGKALFEKILDAVETAKVSDQWRREGGRYIPNPATWLNQQRWDDEPTADGSGGAAPGAGQRAGNRNGVDTMSILDDIINAGEDDFYG